MRLFAQTINTLSAMLLGVAFSMATDRSFAHARVGAAEWSHPHAWVIVRSRLVLSRAGQITGVVHDWTFDDKYSRFLAHNGATEGARATRADFEPSARENAVALARIHYYTTLEIAGKTVYFGGARNYWMELGADRLVTLHMFLPLKAPMAVGRPILFRVSDPTQLIDFRFDDRKPIHLVASLHCTNSLVGAEPAEEDGSSKLSESYFSGIAPLNGPTIWTANRAIINCP